MTLGRWLGISWSGIDDQWGRVGKAMGMYLEERSSRQYYGYVEVLRSSTFPSTLPPGGQE